SSGWVPTIATEKELWESGTQNLSIGRVARTCPERSRMGPLLAFTYPRTPLQAPCASDLLLPPTPQKSSASAHRRQTTALDAIARRAQSDPAMFPPALQ